MFAMSFATNTEHLCLSVERETCPPHTTTIRLGYLGMYSVHGRSFCDNKFLSAVNVELVIGLVELVLRSKCFVVSGLLAVVNLLTNIV